MVGSDEISRNFGRYVEYVKRIEDENRRLSNEIHEARLDLDYERAQRRNMQKLFRNLTDYHLVLIDGNRMVFDRTLLSQGYEGGVTAYRLLRSHFPASEPVHVRVFLAMESHANVLLANGIVASPGTIREFFRGFADPCNKYSLAVDVGKGKEKVDGKIKQELNWHLTSAVGCKSVLLGGSHDNGYARVLKELELENVDRIELLKGPPFGSELERLPFKKVSIGGLFEPGKLASQAQHQQTPICLLDPSSPPDSPTQPQANSAPGSPPPKHRASPVQWLQAPSQPVATQIVPVLVPPEVSNYIRSLNPRPCNNHYLTTAGCDKGVACPHSHKYPLNDMALEALKQYVQRIQCKYGHYCTILNCYYGHPPKD